MLAHTSCVRSLSTAEWAERITSAAQPIPFGRLPWIEIGLTENPDLRFAPVEVTGLGDGPLLVPLCCAGDEAQIGAYGYGLVFPAPGRCGEQPPSFARIADAVCHTLGLRAIHTLLPPQLPGLPGWLDSWDTTPGRQTYLLDVSLGADPTWAAAKGRMRTAVRRAQSWGLSAGYAAAADADAIGALHSQTMARHGVAHRCQTEHLRSLVRQTDDAVLAVLARSGRDVAAASVFAVGGNVAYHVMQVTSDHGRNTNAGYLSFWSALTTLIDRGVRLVDLGAAANTGQAKFKTGWGATPLATRRVAWQREGTA